MKSGYCRYRSILFSKVRSALSKAFFLALASALLFGAATPANKVLLSSVQPLQLAGLISFGASLVALILRLKAGGIMLPWRLDRLNQLRLYTSLGFGGTLGPVLLLSGLRLTSAGSVSMWLNLELAFTAALAALFFHEHLGWRGWTGVGTAVCAGSLLSVGEGLSGVVPGALVCAACLCWGLDNNVTATLKGISPAEIVFWKGLVSGLVNTTLALAFQPAQIDLISIALGLLVGILSFGLSLIVYIMALRSLGATRTQTVFASAPFWGLALSAVLLQKGINLTQAAAAAILVLALVLIFSDRHENTQP